MHGVAARLAWEVDATRGDVARYEHALLALAERVSDARAVRLGLARVEWRVAHAHRVKELGYKLRLVGR